MKITELKQIISKAITEAKEDKAKKIKKEEKLPKSSGKLIDLKKELAALKQMKDELQAAKFAEKTAETEVEFANLQKFAKELDKLRAGGVALESNVDAKIVELEAKIDAEKNKIREMIGLQAAPGAAPIEDVQAPEAENVDEAKGTDDKAKKTFNYFSKKDKKAETNDMIKKAKSGKQDVFKK